jgi:hypothetical protein
LKPRAPAPGPGGRPAAASGISEDDSNRNKPIAPIEQVARRCACCGGEGRLPSIVLLCEPWQAAERARRS